mmetsp:Transcript_23270/g.35387  ORF Transcript_23270/g.35387 Transcript_23270/m.35387 type:complete len:975 (+) Transcript_23270:109-3033(+)
MTRESEEQLVTKHNSQVISKMKQAQTMIKSLEINLECPICLDKLKDTHIIPQCQHRFCGPCIKESLRKCNTECPSCRVHVPTRRSLRPDNVFDSLITELSDFVQESAIDASQTDLIISASSQAKRLRRSLKNLQTHFKCMLCFAFLEETHLFSTECLHRFCKDCIGGFHIDDKTSNVNGCPCCIVQNQTTFCEDRLFGSIASSISSISNVVSQISGIDDSDDDEDSQSNSKIVEDCNSLNNDEVYDHENNKESGNSLVKWGEEQMKRLNRMMLDDSVSETLKDINDSVTLDTKRDCELDENKFRAHDMVTRADDRSTSALTVPITAKYPTGTHFIHKDMQKYGRVVGFDSSEGRGAKGIYQIYYPRDASCDSFYEVDFDRVQIIKGHKRPSNNHNVSNHAKDNSGDNDSDDQVPRCLMCTEMFSSNPQLTNGSGKTPIQSQKCGHVICIDCIQAVRIRHGQSQKKRLGSSQDNTTCIRNLRSTIDCPFCKKPKAFNAIEPTVCLSMCRMVTLYQQLTQKKELEDRREKVQLKDQEKHRRDRRRYKLEKKDKHETVRKRCHTERDKERHQNPKPKKKRQEESERNKGKRQKDVEHANSYQKTNEKEKIKAAFLPDALDETKDDENGCGDKNKDLLIAAPCSSSRGKPGSNASTRRCGTCKKEKETENFSSKQLQRGKKGKSSILCRRCEEKGIIQRQFGKGVDKIGTALFSSKEHGSKAKFLTTIIPCQIDASANENMLPMKQSPLPSKLILDGYTRDEWGCLTNKDSEQEHVWMKTTLWSTGGDRVLNFISFLHKHQKSAYGTFILPDGTDGFFVVPYDQPLPQVKRKVKKEHSSSHFVFKSKHVLKVGLIGENWAAEENDPQAKARIGGVSNSGSGSTLRKFLAAESKNRLSLAAVPQGSVKIVKKIVRPEAPGKQFNGGANDWFREKIVIKEAGEDDEDSHILEGVPDQGAIISNPDLTLSGGVDLSGGGDL